MVGDNFITRSLDRKDDGQNAMSVPTREDVLDVNFWAIVATCRHIISGTAGPRMLSELAGGWRSYEISHKTERRVSPEAKKRMSASARLGWQKRRGEAKMEMPNIDIQQKLDDALAGSEEAQKYIDKVWYLPSGTPVPPAVTHNLVLTSARNTDDSLHLGIVANDKTAALADVLLALMNHEAAPPVEPGRSSQDHGRR